MIRLLAETDSERALAGDQLYVDLDISHTNLPAGTRIALGDPDNGGAVIEVSDKPHQGCAKFQRHFGEEAHGLPQFRRRAETGDCAASTPGWCVAGRSAPAIRPDASSKSDL